jgi:SAM-dependent methyltransferase
VRERRDHCTALIDRTSLRRRDARVLVVACGNLREALRSSAVQARALGELVAFDQDPHALETVRTMLGDRVTCRHGSVRTMIAGGMDHERFDLVYAAGLYDYLDRRVARRLTAKLFELLNPDGELVVANFTHDVPDIGYMESYMAWHLVFRTTDELLDLAAEVPAPMRARTTVYQLHSPDIAYLSMVNA